MDEQRIFETGAKRDNADGKGRMDLLPWNAIIELSKHCERGAKHYGENNVRKGIPFHSLADSGARHLAKWIAGITDEPTHLVAACWNLMWLLEETLTRRELNDMPWNKEAQKEHPDDKADREKKIAEAGEQASPVWMYQWDINPNSMVFKNFLKQHGLAIVTNMPEGRYYLVDDNYNAERR